MLLLMRFLVLDVGARDARRGDRVAGVRAARLYLLVLVHRAVRAQNLSEKIELAAHMSPHESASRRADCSSHPGRAVQHEFDDAAVAEHETRRLVDQGAPLAHVLARLDRVVLTHRGHQLALARLRICAPSDNNPLLTTGGDQS